MDNNPSSKLIRNIFYYLLPKSLPCSFSKMIEALQYLWENVGKCKIICSFLVATLESLPSTNKRIEGTPCCFRQVFFAYNVDIDIIVTAL